MKPTQPDVTFEPKLRKPTTWQEQVIFLAEQQQKNRENSYGQEYAKVGITSETPIGLWLSSDWHIGSGGTDYEAWIKAMKIVKDEPNLYLATLSNTIDNFVFPSGMFAQMIQPHQQMEFIKSWTHDYKDKLLAVVDSRCHEGWTQDRTDVNVNQMMFMEALENGTPFFDKGGVLEIDLNGLPYTVAMVHKGRFSSALNPTNPNRQLHDLKYPTDIVAIAHEHVAHTHHTQKYDEPFRKEVIYVRTGAFKTKDSYGSLEGFPQGQIGGTVVILDPKRKNMEVMYHLDNAAEYLKALREKSEIEKVGYDRDQTPSNA